MSVVSAMVFNEAEGAIVADEMASTEARKYVLYNKLQGLKVNGSLISIIGGVGSADMLKLNLDFIKSVAELKDSIHTTDEFMELFAKGIHAHKIDMIETILQSNTGLSFDDFRAGHFMKKTGELAQMEENMKEFYESVVNGEMSVLNTTFLALNKDPKGIDIYLVGTMPMIKPTKVANYKSVGSGADIADYVIYSFFEKIPREKRNKIDKIEGLATLLQASDRAAAMNHGVGGTYHVAIISGSDLITPSENNTRLASEIAKAHKKGYLSKKFMKSSLQELLYEGASFEPIEEKMFDAARGRGREMLRMLRGYKV